MSAPNKTHQKDAPWMDDKYLPPGREKTVSNDREHSDRYRRWSPDRRNSSSSRWRSDWKYDQNRDRYQNRQHWNYHSKPYKYGERRWSTYDGAYSSHAGPHPSERAPRERADSQQPDVQSSARSTRAPRERADSQQTDVQSSASSSLTNVANNTSGSKSSIVIKKVKKTSKNKQSPCGPPAREDFTMNKFITEHLTNTLFWMPPTNEPMMHTHNALINKIIADEAIRMLSSAASSNEPTSLNEPCDDTASATPLVTGSSNETTPTPVGTDTTKPIANATVTADSALLQKSAEQVTRKLINQLTTMSKYNLKQMIDNPAGKYETALNKHAQNKLRAEVRKQLKNFNLADAVRAKDSSFGSDVMAPDEAIDADKIPAELLEQIGQALDFDFYDLSGSEPRDSTEGNADCLIVDAPNDQPVGSDKPPTSATRNEGASVAQQVQRQIIENVNNSAENLVHNAYSPSELPTGSAGVEAGTQSLAAEPTPPAKIVSFLRVSTVDELNKRIETTNEDVIAICQLPQPPLTASEPQATSGIMVIPEISSTSTEPTVSVSSISGPPRREYCPSKATTKSTALPSAQSSPDVNPTLTKSLVAKGHTQQHKSLPTKRPDKGQQRYDPSKANCGSQENNSPAGKKKAKSSKKTPKKNPNQPATVEESTGQLAPVRMPFPPKGSASMLTWENSTWPNTKPRDSPETSARNDWGNLFNDDPANQPISEGTSTVPGWDRESVVPNAATAATNGECNLRTKSPEPVPISSRSPQSGNNPALQQNGSGKRVWRCYPPSSKINEQRTKAKDSGKNSTSWNSPKRRRYQQQVPPEVPTAGNVVEESSSKEANVHPQSEIEPDNASETRTSNEQEQVNGSDIRISNVRSLVDETPPTESKKPPMDDLSIPSMEHSTNSTSASTNDHAGEQVVLNEGNQLVPEHADRLAIDNVPVNQPHQGMPEMIVPDLMSPPRPPLVMLLDQMQSIDSQTMELFKRKMEIDANIMKLNGERMEIDQEIVKLQNARDAQMNSLRFALFLPFPADGVQNNCSPLSISLNPGDDRPQDAPTGGTDVGNQVEEKDVVSSTLGSDAQQNTQQQTGCNQERTIRRITKISGNSELMRIFQRRRLLSERSSDDNPTIEDGSTPNDQPRS
uniref:Uncharacterized protein n=1 Tax=Anopheles atroparvus TaxID=41427 RepID=A0AAG5D9D1_ANOAO